MRSRLETQICDVLFEDTGAEPCSCTPLEDGCEPICVAPAPPTLPDACANVTPNFENPTGCAPTGNPVTYPTTEIAVVADVTIGFDLDGTSESTCFEGLLAVPDGPGGVDNSLGAADTTSLNRQLFELACAGDLANTFIVDANPESACATVTVRDAGEVITSASLNLTGNCLHGTLGQFRFPPLTDDGATLDNVRVTATLDATGFANMQLGGTANSFARFLIFELVNQGDSFQDIRTDLDATGTLPCDAMSLTLQLGGVAD